MPTLSHHKANTLFKCMNIGPPGGGKTGAIAELILKRKEIGLEKVIFEDWDDGLLILSQILPPEDLECVYYVTLRDNLKASPAGVTVMGAPTAFATGMNMMNNWKEPNGINLGPASTWGPETLFVADSLTGMGDAAMRWSRYSQNAAIEDSDWSYTAAAMGYQDRYIQLLLVLKCHLIVNSHIRYMGGGGTKNMTDKKGSDFKVEVHSISEGTAYPSALGQQLPPQIGRHFNVMLETKLRGTQRIILTKPEINVPLKCPLPVNFPPDLPAETGLLRIWKQIVTTNKEEKVA